MLAYSRSISASCRIGTTVATNALLEQKGERFAFVTTKGKFGHPIISSSTRRAELSNMLSWQVSKMSALLATRADQNCLI